MTKKDREENHKVFLERLRNSQVAVAAVAKHLELSGFTAEIMEMGEAKSHKDWKKFKDNGDIYAYKDGKKYRVEVKGLTSDFENREEYPYPNIIVCAKHSFDNANPKPSIYFHVNNEKTHAGIIQLSTKKFWTEKSLPDYSYKGENGKAREQNSYLVHKVHADFMELLK